MQKNVSLLRIFRCFVFEESFYFCLPSSHYIKNNLKIIASSHLTPLEGGEMLNP